MIGLVFAPSRRQITNHQAATIVSALHQQHYGQRVQVVGLFVNEHPDTINAIADYCELDYVQLSGEEHPEQVGDIRRPIIKSLRLNGTACESAWLDCAKHHGYVVFAPIPFIVDAHVAGAYGGTGVMADWHKAAALVQHQTLMLAGGLTPDNVGAAIHHVHPWGVDVSSGVETNGVKDEQLIASFVQAVRSADAAQHPQFL